MILTCPSCGTQYVVKDGAIPPNGRQVRCAACKHSWHQDPEESADTAATFEAEAAPAEEAMPPQQAHVQQPDEQPAAQQDVAEDSDFGGEDETIAEATLIEPRSGPEAEERAFEEAAIQEDATAVDAAPGEDPPVSAYSEAPAAPESDWREPPVAEANDDGFTPFPTADEEEPRRRSPLLKILMIVLAVVLLAAAFWFLAPPELKARLGLGAGGASQLALVTEHMDRQRLESGNELLTVTGRVINQTGKEQPVPPLQAQLKTSSGQVVYSWTIAPPARSLAPGASASFNSAEVNVPPGGEELTITVGGEPS